MERFATAVCNMVKHDVRRAGPLCFVSEKDAMMGINNEREVTANLQIGPTTMGMVRIYVEGDGLEIPMDFDPEEAEEIAEEIRSAAARARAMVEAPKRKK